MFDRTDLKAPIIIVLWASPRTLSTPFERVFIERGDSEVFHEPFFNSFYYSKDRGSRRELPEEIDNEKKSQDYSVIVNKLLSPCHQQIRFFKDMVFYSYPHLKTNYPDFYHKIINTFIIRKPEDALLSHFKISPDLNLFPEESGFKELYDLFYYVTQILQQRAIVVDADQLGNYPEQVLQKYCNLLGISHYPHSIKWQPGKKIRDWQDWADWHVDTVNSSGIYPTSPEKLEVPVPTWLQELIHSSQKFYAEMSQYTLTV